MINPKNYRVAFHNLGCKVNAYETERMRESFLKLGFRQVSFDSPADIYVVNTCTVTNIADRKSRQMLHRARAMNPNACIAAVGCYVDTKGGETVLADGIDLAVANKEKDSLPEKVMEYLETKDPLMAGFPDSSTAASEQSIFDGSPKADTGGYTRAFLKVQDGCNMFCSYCVIPYARGRIKSPPIRTLVNEARKLGDKGYKEIVLTGIHVSSYGLDRTSDKERLQDLILAISDIASIKRIRLSSLEPRIITEDFVRALLQSDKVCPHFHLSLQSGSDRVLKRMNRHYTSSEYQEKVDLLRSFYDHPAITTDVIVGFPGETDDEFQETFDFLKEIKLYETHIFAYSIRNGTRAASMEGQITQAVKQKRSQILRELCEHNKRLFEDSILKERPEAELLLEDPLSGYTKRYLKVFLENPFGSSGDILRGKLAGRDDTGRLLFKPIS